MASQTYLRRLKHLVFFVGLVFLFTCILSTYAHAQAHNAAGTCQGMSEDGYGCLWSDKFQSLPAITTPHELSGDVPVERAPLPQHEAPSSQDVWKPFLSRSPPQA
jgi:hypothetical protein